MELGNLILKYRKQNNLSQEDLAKEIGVTRQTISKWELNETSPDLKQAAKLAELFGVGVNDLINERNKEDDIKSNEKQIMKNILFKIIKITGITLGIIIFIICMYIIISTYLKGYFSAGPSAQGVYRHCEYNGKITKYEIWRYYDSNQIILNTEDEEIRQKFKTYDYTNENKMLDDIVEYIESNGGNCDVEPDTN